MASIFKDSNGKPWSLAVTVAGIKRVKEATGLLITSLIQDKMRPLGELLSDSPAFCTVAFHLIDPSERQAVTEDDFAALLDGDAVEGMADAFVESLVSFFPSQRTALTKALGKARQAARIMIDRDEAKIDEMTPELLVQKFDAQQNGLVTKSTDSVSSSPVSAA